MHDTPRGILSPDLYPGRYRGPEPGSIAAVDIPFAPGVGQAESTPAIDDMAQFARRPESEEQPYALTAKPPETASVAPQTACHQTKALPVHAPEAAVDQSDSSRTTTSVGRGSGPTGLERTADEPSRAAQPVDSTSGRSAAANFGARPAAPTADTRPVNDMPASTWPAAQEYVPRHAPRRSVRKEPYMPPEIRASAADPTPSSPPAEVTAAPVRPPEKSGSDAASAQPVTPPGEHMHPAITPSFRAEVAVARTLAGRDTKISDLPTDVAANARGVAAIAKHYINHLFGNDKNTKGNSTPHEVPDAATVDGYLQKYGETYIGVMNAAKILDGTKREKGSAATESAKAIIHLGKRVLPAVIADHTPQSEHDLHLTTNAIIAANFGRDQRRNGPTAAPLLWTRAACLAGKTLLVSPNTPGGKERAVAALEALERSLHRTLRGHGYGSVAMPQEVTDIQQAYSSAKQLAAEKGETYDQAMTRMASVAADYARTIVSREAAAEQAKRQPLPVAEVQQAGPTPAQKKAERVVKYAATVLRPTEQLAWGAQDALSSLNEIAGNLKLGDIKAMPYGRLERYEQHAADALRSTVALMEQAEHGDPDTAQKAATALGQLETGGALIRYAYLHKDDVARGEVSPEMAKLITRYEPQSVAEKAAIGQLKEALTDAAYRNLPYGKAYAPSVMNTADGKTIPHQLRLADATEKSIAEFVREAYVDSLSSVTAEPGRLTPQQMEFLAKSADDRVVRMYRHAKNIKNTRAIPEQLQDMYNTVMSQGRELTGAKRLGRAASFMDEMLAHNGAGRPRA